MGDRDESEEERMFSGLRRVACWLSVLLTGAATTGTAHADPVAPAAWLWTSMGTPGGVTAVERVGAVSIPDGSQSADRPYVFVLASDGTLRGNWPNGSSWIWSNLGAPEEGIVGGVGVAGIKNSLSAAERPYAFVLGKDGNLWVNQLTGSTSTWTNHRSPEVGIDAGLGVVEVKDTPTSAERSYTFVRGKDGNLWVNEWVGNGWTWTNQGKPDGRVILGAAGVTKVRDSSTSPERPHAFVRASDGNLWLLKRTGGAWTWTSQGAPRGGIDGPVDAITVSSTSTGADRLHVFTRDRQGNLWLNQWTGSAWTWTDQGKPGNGVIGRVGAVSVRDSPSAPQRPYAFVRTKDGHMWVNQWTGSAWTWTDQGMVPDGVDEGIGVTTVKDAPSAPQRPYAFIRTPAGGLALSWWR
ncbi:hypothetical protein FHS29_003950 [Saccharothrix tamanrassetensis]|uniref:Uncharacterized protein n=1 Tax=Saccharothrix tamanrassetensis TaxID=1051531 RepID=A0A841CMP4_9PSEU|nr:hypothetical protein [Saccharothrix tamanrassetensis]MBB5957357.1 hypothetical protein [Saccharothrix tamanrassetensis]